MFPLFVSYQDAVYTRVSAVAAEEPGARQWEHFISKLPCHIQQLFKNHVGTYIQYNSNSIFNVAYLKTKRKCYYLNLR